MESRANNVAGLIILFGGAQMLISVYAGMTRPKYTDIGFTLLGQDGLSNIYWTDLWGTMILFLPLKYALKEVEIPKLTQSFTVWLAFSVCLLIYRSVVIACEFVHGIEAERRGQFITFLVASAVSGIQIVLVFMYWFKLHMEQKINEYHQEILGQNKNNLKSKIHELKF